MPLVNGDPIVESGSNSDGEWTRWADGTQEARILGKSLVDGTTTKLPSPVPFIDSSFSVQAMLVNGPTSGSHSLMGSGNSATVSKVYLNNGSGDRPANILLSGRWK